MRAAGFGNDPLADLFLDHQRHLAAPIARLQPAHEERRRHIIGQVGNDHGRNSPADPFDKARPVRPAGIAALNMEPPAVRLRPCLQRRGKARVSLHRYDTRRARVE